ncbi:NAD(P)H-dependent flavin oxidoreductase [Spongiimicrobium salis]|uniref:NAD(P)H-dependent flavin oxidoreductase n=1 Tax=Spongiimicrobium salis TaxID=1667022 RepID=UPI00374D6475
MKTEFTTLLGIDCPIVQAPIGSATNAKLASEVSNAGGLGMLALSWKSLKDCENSIRETKRLTHRPFGVNLVLDRDQKERVALCIAEKVAVVSFFWGDSSPYIGTLKAHGIKVCQTVPNVQEAVKYENAGVDFLIVQGWEAGGHVQGTIANTILIPAVADKVKLPIIAAGGFADGRGLVAALALGASGISMGTRFLMSKEAQIEEEYANLIAAATEEDTIYAKDLFHIGWENAPHRVLRNSTVKAWEHQGRPVIGERPGEGEIVGYTADKNPIYRYSDNNPIKGSTGNLEAMALYAGQTAGLVNQRLPAKEIIKETLRFAADTLKGLNNIGPEV